MRYRNKFLSVVLVLWILSVWLIPIPVLALTGSIIVVPLTGPVGTTVTLSGTGFTAGSIYTLKIDTTAIINGTITSGGALNASTFILPQLPVGTHTLTVNTASAGGVAQDTSNSLLFTVTPRLTLATASGQVGDSIGTSGTGYKANAAVSLYFGGISAVSVNSDSNGSFVTNLLIPGRAYGDYTISATDVAANTAAAIFTINPSLSLTPTSVAVGSQLVINGKGFNPNSATKIYLDGNNVLTVTSNTNGAFTLDYTVPARHAGNHNLAASDVSGHTASATFTVTPSIAINPAIFSTGSQIFANGQGFTAASAIAVYIDGQIRDSSITTTDANGSFTMGSYPIPSLSGGSHTFALQDNNGRTVAVTFNVAPSIEVKPAAGASGATVQVTGKSFGANKNLTVAFDGIRIGTTPTVVTTDTSGVFTSVFIVPASFSGNHTVAVSDGTLTATQNFTLTATASINPIAGIVGTNVTITGNGFGSKSNVQIKYDRTAIASIIADSNGIFSTSVNIPGGATGLHTLTATDGNANLSYNFTIIAHLDINPATGNVGTKINLTGTGYLANSKVTLSYDNHEVDAIITNDSGGFTAVVEAPNSLGGKHLLTASDGASNLTANFAMETTAPLTPKPELPLDHTKAVSLTLFQWQAVTDPSGITYNLQVSRDINFASLLLEKTNLTSPSYQLGTTEKLKSVSKSQPYYWRVKAVDGAANESPWTTPQNFYVGLFIPDAVQYIILGFALIIAGLLGFLLGRRRHPKTPATPPKGDPAVPPV